MIQRPKNGQIPAGSPLANLLVIVAGALTIAVSVVVGFVALVALAGFVLIVAVVISVRTWWLRRKMARNDDQAPDARSQQPSAVIEGEFKVLGKDDSPRQDG